MADLGQLASSCDKIIRESAQALSKSSLRIGWYGYILRQNNLFGTLGFSCEKDYYESCKIGRSTWYRAVSIAESLQHLGKDAVLSMNVENARILAKVPEGDDEFAFLSDEAIVRPTKEFADLAKGCGINTGRVNARQVDLTIPVSADDKRRILATLKQWQKEYRLPTLADALKDICAVAQQKSEIAA